MSTKSTNELDQAFAEFEQECGGSKTIRREMIENLRKVANNPEMQPSPYDKAMVIQSKLMVVKTLDDLLKSDEDLTLKRLKMKLSRKDSETNGAVGSTIVALLKQIRSIGEPTDGKTVAQDQAKAKNEVAARIEELKKSSDPKVQKQVSVVEGELLECGVGEERPDRPEDEAEEE